MFQIFEIRGKRFKYSNNIRAKKLSNPNPNIQDSRKKIRIRIESEYIRSSLIKITIGYVLAASFSFPKLDSILVPVK